MSGWVNYDSVMLQLREQGLDVHDLRVRTHKPVRVREIDGDREKRCWYWLSDIELANGQGQRGLYITGAWGIFRGNERIKGKIELKRGKAGPQITAEQRAAMKIRQAEAQKRARAIRDAEIKRAAAAAQGAWSRYQVEGESTYLRKKQVGAHGVRFSPSGNGTIAVPMADAQGRLFGLQVIRSGRRRRLQKEYWPRGLDKIGHFHMIGQALAAAVILVCEGYATAATLHEETGLPVAVAFDAGNLVHVAKALADAYPSKPLLICADDDYWRECPHCKAMTPFDAADCRECGEPHGKRNDGVEAAKAAAHAVDGAWVAPAWPFARNPDDRPTDFNDLATHPQGGPQLVANRIQEALREQGWAASAEAAVGPAAPGGAGGRRAAASILSLDDAVERFLPIDDGTGKVLFDQWTQKLVLREQLLSLLPAGLRWDDVKSHPLWIRRGSFYLDEVGFDPAGTDDGVRLNTWTGWPTTPAAGDCSRTLDLLRYLCSAESNADEIFEFLLRWLAYPIQNPGAKMKSAVVVHGPQGTGKSIVFEAVMRLYGEYGMLLNQGAIEDKFNSDWSSRKLLVVADEIVARQEMHHIKNQLKGLITGDWVRVNPKNLPAYRERNHMNLVFLSNERQPVVLENDDRRHAVIWTPPALSEAHYNAVAQELEGGGLEALHQHLLDVDLTGFHPWTRPPMTSSKEDLQVLGRGSVEAFIAEWMGLEVENAATDTVVPFCPCKGEDLYHVYRKWCERTGERDLGIKRLIGHVKKMHGWEAGRPQNTWRNFQDRVNTSRKMVVPAERDLVASIELDTTGAQERLQPDQYESKRDWMTACFFAFRDAAGIA